MRMTASVDSTIFGDDRSGNDTAGGECPATLDELAGHHCTGFRMPSTGRLMPWAFRLGEEIVYRDIPATFCTDPETEMEAVTAGFGIGLLDAASAAEHIRAGRLVPLLCEHVRKSQCAASSTSPSSGCLYNSTRFHLSVEQLETQRRSFLARQGQVALRALVPATPVELCHLWWLIRLAPDQPPILRHVPDRFPRLPELFAQERQVKVAIC
jgi:hypothetical protein